MASGSQALLGNLEMTKDCLILVTCVSLLTLVPSCLHTVELRGFIGRAGELGDIRAGLRAAGEDADVAEEELVPRNPCGLRDARLREAPLWDVGVGPSRLYALDFDGRFFLLDEQSGPAPLVTNGRAFNQACNDLIAFLFARGDEVLTSRTGIDGWIRLGDERSRWLADGWRLDTADWGVRQFRARAGVTVCVRRPWGSDEPDAHLYECFELPDLAGLSRERFLGLCGCIPLERKRRAGRWSVK